MDRHWRAWHWASPLHPGQRPTSRSRRSRSTPTCSRSRRSGFRSASRSPGAPAARGRAQVGRAAGTRVGAEVRTGAALKFVQSAAMGDLRCGLGDCAHPKCRAAAGSSAAAWSVRSAFSMRSAAERPARVRAVLRTGPRLAPSALRADTTAALGASEATTNVGPERRASTADRDDHAAPRRYWTWGFLGWKWELDARQPGRTVARNARLADYRNFVQESAAFLDRPPLS